MKPLSVLIVDDEVHGRDNLANLLHTHCPNASVVDVAAAALEAMDKIAKHKPEVVFLDVMMPGMTGLEFLESIPVRSFAAVLVTGYANYGIQAVKNGVADYLLKPIDIPELKKCVAKIYNRLRTPQENEIKASFVQQHIAISHSDGFHMIEIDQILYLKGADNYTRVFLTDGRELLVSRTLKDFEEILPIKIFFRIHKSYIANVRHVKEYLSIEGGIVVMPDKKQIPVSRRKLSEFQEMLRELAIFPQSRNKE